MSHANLSGTIITINHTSTTSQLCYQKKFRNVFFVFGFSNNSYTGLVKGYWHPLDKIRMSLCYFTEFLSVAELASDVDMTL